MSETYKPDSEKLRLREGAGVYEAWIDVDTPPESFINDRRQDWLTELSAEDYRRCMSLLEELLGIPYRYSPEATAAALLRHLHNRPGGKRLEVAEMPPPALDPGTEKDLFWIRDLTVEEREQPFIVAYDVNAAYLAACSALPLGVGAPRHVGPVIDEYGVHQQISASGVGYYKWMWEWITGPTLQQMQAENFHCPVVEAWVWDEASRPLEPWYKVLRDARSFLLLAIGTHISTQTAILAALQTIKMMYCGFFGRCASTKWDRTGDPLFRPDWRHMVIATRRTRLQRVMAQTDPAPFAAYSDALYFAVPSSPQVQGLKLGTNPGSFKIHGTVRHEGEVRAAIADGRLTRLVELVK